MFPKPVRQRLTGKEYKQWAVRVMARDGYQCRKCGSRRNLQVHHIIKRSKQRLDTMGNGICLCALCHEDVERHRIDIVGEDANSQLLTFITHTDKIRQDTQNE